MVSRLTTLVMFITLPCLAVAQVAEIGSVIAVRGTVEDCVQWPDRVLDVQEVVDESPITLLEAIEVDALGADAEQILSRVLDVIEIYTDKRPSSLWVEVLPAEMYETLASEYIYSENYLLDGKCPGTPRPPFPEIKRIDMPGLLKDLDKKRKWRDIQDHRLRQDQIREYLRQLEVLDSTA